MKRIKWERCGGSGASGDQNPLEFQNGMHVAAKYAGLDVHLKIVDIGDRLNIKAVVLYLEPISRTSQSDLQQGDLVIIGQDEIFWAHDD